MKAKKFLTAVLAFAVLLACMGVTAMAAGETTVAKIGDNEYATLTEAIAAANQMTDETVTVEIYGKGEYTAETANLTGSYKTINFVGKTADAEISITRDGSVGYISGSGSAPAVTFADLILSKPTGAYANDAGFMNVYFTVYRVASVNYTNCTFPDGACAQGCPVTYDDCDFANNTSGEYSLWVYANTTVTVTDSTFTGVRGAKMYAEGAAKTGNLVLENTTFTESVTQKPAIVLTYGESVTLTNNTYPAKGVFELDADGSPNGTAITADITDISCISGDNDADCGVLVDGKIYTTIADAAVVAESGSTVTLMYSTEEKVELAEGVTLNKNSYTADNVTVALNWTTATDAGFYMVGEEKVGMMRFLFAADVEGVTASGIKFIKGKDINEQVGSVTGEPSNAFYGDIVEIPSTIPETNTYYALAYITTAEGTVWSEPLACSPNWTQKFENYTGGAQ